MTPMKGLCFVPPGDFCTSDEIHGPAKGALSALMGKPHAFDAHVPLESLSNHQPRRAFVLDFASASS